MSRKEKKAQPFPFSPLILSFIMWEQIDAPMSLGQQGDPWDGTVIAPQRALVIHFPKFRENAALSGSWS